MWKLKYLFADYSFGIWGDLFSNLKFDSFPPFDRKSISFDRRNNRKNLWSPMHTLFLQHLCNQSTLSAVFELWYNYEKHENFSDRKKTSNLKIEARNMLKAKHIWIFKNKSKWIKQLFFGMCIQKEFLNAHLSKHFFSNYPFHISR